MPTLKAEFLRQAVGHTFFALGTPEREADVVADHLVDAELCGVTSHGIIRVGQYVQGLREGRIKPDAQLSVLRETAATAALDGGQGFGQVMACHAVDKATQLASDSGTGVVTLANCSHTGRLGYYTEQAARRGFVAMMFVNSGGYGQWVAPFGGIAARLSTNPLSIAAPSAGEFPLVLDIATSIAPEGKIRALRTAGKSLPAGWAIDHDGRPITNPAELYGPPRGAILPFGGHKGFGLALLVDALAGGLSGAGCCADAQAPLEGHGDGVLFVAIRPNAFGVDFSRQIQQLISHVKSSPPAPGVSEILVPGELEFRRRQRYQREGIPVDDEVWRAVEPALL